MRYQSPITNPLSQYWEEEFVFTSPARLWRDLYVRFRYVCSEHLLTNMLLVMSIAIEAASIRPFSKSISTAAGSFNLNSTVKRSIDIFGSTIGLILLMPLMAIAAIVIKLDSPGPVFFRQERIGLNRRTGNRRVMNVNATESRRTNDRRKNSGYGRPFMIIKFRSMCNNAEGKSGPVWAKKNDARITRVGASIRKTRIDEIPQLINVLKGEMSLVGPRPERAFFIEKLKNKIENYQHRLDVKPGVTGLAQVEHKYDESEEDTKVKVRFDLDYVKGLNLVKDIRILIKTVYVVLAAKGM